jgi:cytochrome c biogenesis protein CcdA
MFEYLIAFGAGLISFLSPCVLPLIPGYISYISGQSLQEIQKRLKDGWTFSPSTKITKSSKDKIKADAVVENKPDLDGPKDLTTEE